MAETSCTVPAADRPADPGYPGPAPRPGAQPDAEPGPRLAGEPDPDVSIEPSVHIGIQPGVHRGVAPEPGPSSEPDAEPEPERVRRRPALSPSRAADFKQCPLLYRFRAIDHLPEMPGAAQVRGTLVHAVLDRLFALPAAERVPAAARELIAPAWAQLVSDDPRLAEPAAQPADSGAGDAGSEPEVRLAGIEALLDAYFTLEDPRALEPEARELLVEAELESGLLLRGYLDRVDLSPAGRIRVVDYKTGTAPQPVSEMRALFQMKFYALMLLLVRGVVPAELRLMYLTEPEALTYVPDEVELRRFARTLEAMWAAILAAGVTGDFRPNTGPWCAGCAHQELCPAWGGVPPPYPGWPVSTAAERPDGSPVEAPAVEAPAGEVADAAPCGGGHVCQPVEISERGT